MTRYHMRNKKIGLATTMTMTLFKVSLYLIIILLSDWYLSLCAPSSPMRLGSLHAPEEGMNKSE